MAASDGDFKLWSVPSPSSRPCAFCRQDVGSGPTTSCRKCAAVYHPDCWETNDRRCAIYGCVQVSPPPALVRRVAAPPVFHPVGQPRRSGMGGITFLLVIVGVNLLRLLSGPSFSGKHPHVSPPQIRIHDADFSRTLPATRPQGNDDDIAQATLRIEMNPRDAGAYFARGAAQRRKGLPEAAMQDFDRAIELNPALGPAYHLRGHLKVERGDLKGAIPDFTQAFAHDPQEPEAIYDRACALFDLHSWKESLADFAVAYEKSPSLRDYSQLRMCLARSQLEFRPAAMKDLAAYAGRTSNNGDAWVAELLRFVAGQSGEESLLASAARFPRERQCQADYYVGMQRLLDGDRERARESFSKCLETESTEFREYASARVELRAMTPRK